MWGRPWVPSGVRRLHRPEGVVGHGRTRLALASNAPAPATPAPRALQLSFTFFCSNLDFVIYVFPFHLDRVLFSTSFVNFLFSNLFLMFVWTWSRGEGIHGLPGCSGRVPPRGGGGEPQGMRAQPLGQEAPLEEHTAAAAEGTQSGSPPGRGHSSRCRGDPVWKPPGRGHSSPCRGVPWRTPGAGEPSSRSPWRHTEGDTAGRRLQAVLFCRLDPLPPLMKGQTIAITYVINMVKH